MATLMEQEKQRISQRLARLDAEREKLSGTLDELEIAERVLARFGRKAVTTEKRGEHARQKRRRGLLRRVEAEATRKRLVFRSATPL